MSMPAATVSVIIPAYNCAEYLGAALASVVAQDYPAIEVIVVDDGSTDGTGDTAAAFGAKVRLIRQANAGPAAARNRALAIASGQYIAFLDGDDVWLPGKLAAQMRYFATQPDTPVVYGRWARWYPNEGEYPPASAFVDAQPADAIDRIDAEASGSIYTGMLLDSMVHSITAVAHRRVFDRLGGFDEQLRTGEDYDFWLRATRHFNVAKLARNVALYRIRRGSASAAQRPENNEYRVLMRTLSLYGDADINGRRVDRAQLNRRLAQLCFGHGYRHYWRGDVRIAYRSFRLALRHSDFHPRTMAYCAGAAARCAALKVSSTLMGGLHES